MKGGQLCFVSGTQGQNPSADEVWQSMANLGVKAGVGLN